MIHIKVNYNILSKSIDLSPSLEPTNPIIYNDIEFRSPSERWLAQYGEEMLSQMQPFIGEAITSRPDGTVDLRYLIRSLYQICQTLDPYESFTIEDCQMPVHCSCGYRK